MGKLNFYLMDQEYKEEKGINVIMESRLEGKKISYIGLNQLSDKTFFNQLKEDNIDYFFSPYDRPKVNINKLKEALESGVNFHVKTNIKYLDEIKKQFKEVGFSYEI